MSLINDALKRAQQAQTPQLPRGPMLRPVEPEPKAVKQAGLLMPALFTLIILGVLFGVWKFVGIKRGSQAPEQPEVVRAMNPPTPTPPAARVEPVPAAKVEPAPVAKVKPVSVAKVEPVPAARVKPVSVAKVKPAPVAPPSPVRIAASEPAALAQPAPQPVAKPVVATQPSPEATVESAVVQASVPRPFVPVSEFRLQSIVFSRPPSAMISGAIVRVGDELGGYTVTSIEQTRVELSSGTQTIVLTLK